MSQKSKDETRNEAVDEVVDSTAPAEEPHGETANQPDAAALEKAVRQLEEQLQAEKDKLLRLAAEYDNFRKRTAKERESLFSEIRGDTIAQLLPVYDNLARALKQPCTDEAYFKGIQLIMAQLEEIFANLGVTEIPAAGEKFDANRHHAVMHVEDPEKGESVVVEELEKGFMIGDRVIRFSTVIVAN
ncbi:MAG TPA: nucleotide exchange factor GrpE [Papillibacter sp.]|nr:nucleotide exchange factor GrpE [Papillibacter sp.]